MTKDVYPPQAGSACLRAAHRQATPLVKSRLGGEMDFLRSRQRYLAKICDIEAMKWIDNLHVWLEGVGIKRTLLSPR